MNIYAELLSWTLVNYQRLKTEVETDIGNMEKRRLWTEKANQELMALCGK